MNKSFSLIAVSLLGLSHQANADTFLGVYAGAQGWNMGTEGGFANTSSLTNFEFEDETKASFYVALEHFIPLVPNIKLRSTEMDTAGDVTLTSSFTFGDTLFTTNSDLLTQIDFSTTDIILYYEFFDNDLISFDFGINGKYVDGTLFVEDSADSGINAEEDFSGIVPMLYSRIAFGLPFTGWGVYAEGSYLAIDDHSLSDYQVAITYSLIDSLAVDVTLQAGYRALILELEDLDDIYTDIDFEGVFAGIEVHF